MLPRTNGPLCIARENAKQRCHLRTQFGVLSTIWPRNSTLNGYSSKMKMHFSTKIYIWMSMTALFKEAKNKSKSVQFSHSVVSDSLQPHESQHSRPSCPSPTPRVQSNLRPSSRWCHLVISSSVIPFSSWPQSLPASFPMSQLFAWGGQSTGVSALASFLPKKSQGSSPSEWTGWISLQSKGLSRVFINTTVQKHHSSALSFLHSPTLTYIHDHWKNHSLDYTDLCWQNNVSAFQYAIYVGRNFSSKE